MVMKKYENHIMVQPIKINNDERIKLVIYFYALLKEYLVLLRVDKLNVVEQIKMHWSNDAMYPTKSFVLLLKNYIPGCSNVTYIDDIFNLKHCHRPEKYFMLLDFSSIGLVNHLDQKDVSNKSVCFSKTTQLQVVFNWFRDGEKLYERYLLNNHITNFGEHVNVVKI